LYSNCSENIENEASQSRKQFIDALTKEEKRLILQQYLISHMFKDISIMITFHLDPLSLLSIGSNSDHEIDGVVSFGDSRCYFHCAVVDIDLKHVNKIPYYYELDQQIISNYSKYLTEITDSFVNNHS
jgi:inositol-pentakisphosphate 2-kinase